MIVVEVIRFYQRVMGWDVDVADRAIFPHARDAHRG